MTKTKQRGKKKHKLLDRAIDILKKQMQWTYALPPIEIEVIQRDNKTVNTHLHQPIFVNMLTRRPHSSSSNYAKSCYYQVLKRAKVRYRGPNQARHTFICKMLTAGMPKEWIAQRVGHTTTKMIDEHYGEFITEDLPGLEEMASQRLSDLMESKPFDDHFSVKGKPKKGIKNRG